MEASNLRLIVVTLLAISSVSTSLPNQKWNSKENDQRQILKSRSVEVERTETIPEYNSQNEKPIKNLLGPPKRFQFQPSETPETPIPQTSIASFQNTKNDSYGPLSVEKVYPSHSLVKGMRPEDRSNQTLEPDGSVVSNSSEKSVDDRMETEIPEYTPTAGEDDKSPLTIEIPNKYENILAMQRDPAFQNHPGLKAALSATQRKRSRKNAYILFIGLAGAGKSSTINFLFGKQVAAVNAITSTKSEITEYSVNVTLPGLGVKNSQLRIIDTPGLGSSRGVEYDARIIASLKSFLREHEELGDALPNAVLIFSKFDDNRIDGNSSTFVKMLKGYNMIRQNFVPANESSNIIYVLTRLMSETKKVARNPRPRLDVFEAIIKKYTTFPKPITICLAENEAIGEELKEVNGSYRLPNKELYPQNLIDGILNISSDPEAKIGFEILKSAFANRKGATVMVRKTLAIFNGTNDEARDTLEQIAAEDFPIHPSEVTETLTAADLKIDPELRKGYPASLRLLQRAFQTRNIKNISEIPTKRSEIVSFLQGSNMNPAMIAIFEKAFALEIPEYQFELLTGYGYDVLKDEPVQTTPFILEEMKFSKMGFLIPDGITGEQVNEEVNILQFFKNLGEFTISRIREFGIQDEINKEAFEAEFPNGYNVIDKESKLPKMLVTSSREIRKFQLTLNERIPFTDKFKEIIDDMPTFNINDRESVIEWKSIFQEYGTHVVGSAYGGGEIETRISLKNDELLNLRNGEVENVRNLMQNLPQNSEYKNEIENNSKDVEISIQLKGGDSKYGKIDLAEMKLPEITEIVKEWMQTLGYESAMLKSKLLLIPLSDIVKPVNASIAVEMQKAMKELLQGTLEYVPPPTPPPTQKTPAPANDDYSNNLEILNMLNQTQRNLEARLAREKMEFEANLKKYREMLATSTAVPIYDYGGRYTTTERPENVTRVMNARDYVWRILTAVPAQYYKIKQKLFDIYDSITDGRLTNEELSLDNLSKMVEAAKKELEITTPRPSRYPGLLRPTEFVPVPKTNLKGPGYGYDLLNERVLSKTPFILTENAISTQKMTRYSHSIEYFHETFTNRQKYINHRVSKTNAKIYISVKVFKESLLPSYALEDTPLQVVKEYRDSLSTLSKFERLTINDGFQEVLRKLPKYDNKNCESRDKWLSLFNEYGTHIVFSAYMGSAIEFTPYGETCNEIYSFEPMSLYFENGGLADKHFSYRAIGGNTQKLRSLSSADLYAWESSVNDLNVVMLPLEIKLIPIHQLIFHKKLVVYHDAMRAFNDYFDGNLRACNHGIQCGPWKSIINGECTCPDHQKLIGSQCRTLAGRKCALDSWDDCLPSSVCLNTGENYGICTCKNGYQQTYHGSCYKTYGRECHKSRECDLSASLGCIHGTCQCVSRFQSYDYQERKCLSRKGNECGVYPAFGISYKLGCANGSVCQRETRTCI